MKIRKKAELPTDFDNNLKEAIKDFIKEAVYFGDARLARKVNWKRTPVFLEQELRRMQKAWFRGAKYCDILVKLWLKTGEEQWVLLHWEIEGNPREDFPLRMLNYCSLLQLRYQTDDIAAIVLYVGKKSMYQTDRYYRQIGGTKKLYQFPIIKVWEQDEAKLLQSKNTFAIVILAILYVLRTKGKFEDRKLFKEKLFELAHQRKLSEQKLSRLLMFVDNFVLLPSKLQHQFHDKVTELYDKKEEKMIITQVNRNYAEMVYKAIHGFSPKEALKAAKKETETMEKAFQMKAEKAKMEAEKAFELEAEKAKMEAEKAKMETEKAKMEAKMEAEKATAERQKAILIMHKLGMSENDIATSMELDLKYVTQVIAKGRKPATKKNKT